MLLLLWFAGFCIVASFFFTIDLCILISGFCWYALSLLVGGISKLLGIEIKIPISINRVESGFDLFWVLYLVLFMGFWGLEEQESLSSS